MMRSTLPIVRTTCNAIGPELPPASSRPPDVISAAGTATGSGGPIVADESEASAASAAFVGMSFAAAM